jgi:hypothetical protein
LEKALLLVTVPDRTGTGTGTGVHNAGVMLHHWQSQSPQCERTAARCDANCR